MADIPIDGFYAYHYAVRNKHYNSIATNTDSPLATSVGTG